MKLKTGVYLVETILTLSYVVLALLAIAQNYLAYGLIACNVLENDFTKLKANQTLSRSERAFVQLMRPIGNFLIEEPWATEVVVVNDLYEYGFMGQMCEDMRKVHPRCNGTFDGKLALDFYRCYQGQALNWTYLYTPSEICREERLLAKQQLRPYLETNIVTESNDCAPAGHYILALCCSVFPTREEILAGEPFQFHPVTTWDEIAG